MPSDSPTLSMLQPDDALVVVDTQRDFCPGGKLPVPDGDAVVPVLNRWIEAARRSGSHLIFTRDWHPRGHCSFDEQGGTWPEHCVQDDPGTEFHPELEVPDDAWVISKGTAPDRDAYSPFQEFDFTRRLHERGVKRLWVGGLTLEICVRQTLLDAAEAGFGAFLIREATRPIREEAVEEVTSELLRAGVVIQN